MRICLWRPVVCLVAACTILQLAACGAASRATVREQDMRKVFPWPNREKKVTIEVMPQTTMANTCSWLGSWQQVEVGVDTTFFITEKTGKKFAYTPSRSSIRRLAPVESMEIRWPIAAASEQPEEGDQAGQDAGAKKDEKNAGNKTDKQTDKKTDKNGSKNGDAGGKLGNAGSKGD